MEHSLGYLVGILVGVLAGVGLIALLFKLKVMDMTFDERQEQARGTAYQYGFCTLVVSIWLFSQFYQAVPWVGVEAGGFLCIDLGVTVFAVTAIWKDAYLGLHKKPGRAAAVLGLCGAGCLCLSAFRMWKEGLLADGTLSLWAVIAVLSVSDLLVLAVFWYRQRSGAGEDDEV